MHFFLQVNWLLHLDFFSSVVSGGGYVANVMGIGAENGTGEESSNSGLMCCIHSCTNALREIAG